MSSHSLKIVSGVFFLLGNCTPPKPYGEDTYFVCEEEGVVGVADGVDAKDYAGELMTRSVYAIQDEFQTKGVVSLKKSLKKAFSSTRSKGSSTLCMVILQGGYIHGINVGDSGFQFFRDNEFQCRSIIQRQGINNDALRLGNSSMCANPNCAQEMKVSARDGDIIVVGTGSLFDNIHSEEIEDILKNEFTKDSIPSPNDLAKKIAHLALRNSLDNHAGEKVDDITVIVGLIQKA